MPSRGLIRLGGAQWVVVASGIATVLAIVWIAYMPAWDELYVREFVVPRLERRYGFEAGLVRFSRDNVSYEWRAIVYVTPGGEFARFGLRPHDVPFDSHGRGWSSMYGALAEAERGRAAAFDVVNVKEWTAGNNRAAFRTITISP